MTTRTAAAIGRLGEDLALGFFTACGYQLPRAAVPARRRRGRPHRRAAATLVVFVEVKTRGPGSWTPAHAAVTAAQLRRLRGAARAWLAEQPAAAASPTCAATWSRCSSAARVAASSCGTSRPSADRPAGLTSRARARRRRGVARGPRKTRWPRPRPRVMLAAGRHCIWPPDGGHPPPVSRRRPGGMNYWHILEEARTALAAGRYRDAEEQYEAAIAARTRSPRRVFFTETSVDLARRLTDAVRAASGPTPTAGRWERAVEALRARFRRRAPRRPSRAPCAPPTCAPRTTPSATSPCSPPASTWSSPAASRRATPAGGGAAGEGAAAHGPPHGPRLRPRSPARRPAAHARRIVSGWPAPATRCWSTRPPATATSASRPHAWARTLLDLLAPAYFPDADPRGRPPLVDRHAQRPPSRRPARDPRAVTTNASRAPSSRRPRAAAARARCVETARQRHRRPISPCRTIARRAPCSPRREDAEPGTPAYERLAQARAVLDHRHPRGPGLGVGVHRRRRPRAPGAVVGRMPARRRRRGARARTRSRCAICWRRSGAAPLGRARRRRRLSPRRWARRPVRSGAGAAALGAAGTARCPRDPLTPQTSWRLALARSGPWRDDWRPGRGHPLLTPPGRRRSARRAARRRSSRRWRRVCSGWPACVASTRPTRPCGPGSANSGGAAMRAAAFIHDCAVLDSPAKRSLDEGFAAWTLPLLWTRPDPLPASAARDDEADRPDLAGNDVTVVNTGRPGRPSPPGADATAAGASCWTASSAPTELGEIAREAYGPVTLVPGRRRRARPRRGPGLARRTGAHAARGRRRAAGGGPLDAPGGEPQRRPARRAGGCGRARAAYTRCYDLYAEAVARLPREAPRGRRRRRGTGWGAQFAQRVRKSGLVAGAVDDLPEDPAALDAVWGVFEGSDASWVFLDSAAIHWQLWRRDPGLPARLHARLVSARPAARVGRRRAAASWPPTSRRASTACSRRTAGRTTSILRDDAAPRLRLAARGPVPGARLLATESWCAPLQHLATATATRDAGPRRRQRRRRATSGAGPQPSVRRGRLATVISAREIGFASADRHALVVPRLACFDDPAAAAPVADGGHGRRRGARRTPAAARPRRRARILASLEVNALLAAPVAVVEILDGRWWRRLPAGPRTRPRRPRRFGGAAEVVDLPSGDATTDLGVGGRDVAGRARVRRRLRRAAAGPGRRRDEPVPGVHLHAGDGGAGVERPRALAAARLGGRRADRTAAPVGETPPAGAAEVVAVMGCPGRAMPGVGDDGDARGAPAARLQWLRPRDIARAERDAAAALQPDAVLVTDLGAWLPGAVPRDDDTAHALRWLAGLRRPLGRPRAARISRRPGRDFLAGRLGAAAAARARRIPAAGANCGAATCCGPSRSCPHCGHASARGGRSRLRRLRLRLRGRRGLAPALRARTGIDRGAALTWRGSGISAAIAPWISGPPRRSSTSESWRSRVGHGADRSRPGRDVDPGRRAPLAVAAARPRALRRATARTSVRVGAPPAPGGILAAGPGRLAAAAGAAVRRRRSGRGARAATNPTATRRLLRLLRDHGEMPSPRPIATSGRAACAARPCCRCTAWPGSAASIRPPSRAAWRPCAGRRASPAWVAR